MKGLDKLINVMASKKALKSLRFVGVVAILLIVVTTDALAVDGANLTVIIPSSFLKTTWFYVLVVLFMACLMGVFYQLKIRKMQKQIRIMEMDASQHTIQLEKIKTSQDKVVEKAHKAGMADIASAVLHNVGNVLNSVNTSSSLIKEKVKQSKLDSFIQANSVLREHIDDIDRFVADNPKGKKLMQYYLSLEAPMRDERDELVLLLDRLTEKINLVNEVIADQQSYAGASIELEAVSLSEMIDTALVLQAAFVKKHSLNVTKKLNASYQVMVHRSKLIHMFVNIIKNATESMENNHPENKNLFIETWQNAKTVNLSITDNGRGIERDHQEKIFSHAFTTKKNGHGFGLHSCANYMTEMGGKIEVASEGKGKGATFTLIFPITNNQLTSKPIN